MLATGLAVAGVLGWRSTSGPARSSLATEHGRETARRAAGRSISARIPVFVAVLVVAPLVGGCRSPRTALAIAGLGVGGAIALTVLGCYRSSQDIRPEALQRLAAGVLSVAVGALGLLLPRADAMIAALAVVATVTLHLCTPDPHGGRSRERRAAQRDVPARGADRLLALATVVYYRSGTIALAAVSGEPATPRSASPRGSRSDS